MMLCMPPSGARRDPFNRDAKRARAANRSSRTAEARVCACDDELRFVGVVRRGSARCGVI